MRWVWGLAVLAIGCQEYNFTNGDVKPPGSDTGTMESTTPPDPTTPPEPAPNIEVNPRYIDLGQWPPNCTSPRKTIEITNSGDETLTIDEMSVAPNPGGVFRSLPLDPRDLAPGETTEVNVDFTPSDYRAYPSAAISIPSNDPDEPLVQVVVDGEGSEVSSWNDRFAQEPARPVDVLFIVDNSGSMSGEIDDLANTFEVFINSFASLGLDYQIGVITTDMDDPAQSGRLLGPDPVIHPGLPDPVAAFVLATELGSSGSGSEKGLAAAQAALTAPLVGTTNAGLVRKGSSLSLIVVSDEDDDSADSIVPATFATWLEGYQGDPALTRFSAVAGPPSGIFPCISLISGISATPAIRYNRVVRDTGGIHISFCDMDMTSILSSLAVVSTGLKRTYTLSQTPSRPDEMVVDVEGMIVPHDLTNGVSYDPTSNSITFHGAWIPRPSQTIDVSYEVDTVDCTT